MKRLGFACAILLFVFACNNSGQGVIPSKDMVRIIADIRLLEAGNSLDSNQSLLTNSRWRADYNFIYSKHGVTDSLFRKSYRYYFNRPRDFQSIMEQVIIELQSQEAGMKKQGS